MATKAMIITCQPGGGKSRAASSVVLTPELMPALYIDADDNADSILSRYTDFQIKDMWLSGTGEGSMNPKFVAPTDKLTRIRVTSWESTARVIGALQSMQASGKLPFKTVILDSMTMLDTFLLDWASANPGTPLKNDTRDVSPLGIVVHTISDYGRHKQEFPGLVMRLKLLPIVLIMCAHLRDKEVDKVTTEMVNISGSANEIIVSMVPVGGVIRLPRDNTSDKRVMTFRQRANLIAAKDNSEGGKLSQDITYGPDDPIIAMILDRLGVPVTLPDKFKNKATTTA